VTAAAWPIVCATGHRRQHLSHDAREWIRDELHQQARRLRDEYGTHTGISGMASGVDLWWAEALLAAGLNLWAYVPFPQQPDRWPDADRREWRRILDRAQRVRTFGDRYSVRLLHARNHGMLSDSTAVVACWAPHMTTGGTFAAVREAHRRGMPGVWIDPRARSVVDRIPDPANPHNRLVITCGGRAVDDAFIPPSAHCAAPSTSGPPSPSATRHSARGAPPTPPTTCTCSAHAPPAGPSAYCPQATSPPHARGADDPTPPPRPTVATSPHPSKGQPHLDHHTR
jgi:uncharacterized phage-like protein YoqJ